MTIVESVTQNAATLADIEEEQAEQARAGEDKIRTKMFHNYVGIGYT